MQTSQLFYTKRVTFSILHTYFFNYFILLQFFIIPSLTASLSYRPITTNDHFTPSHHHHPPVTIITTQPTSSRKTNPLNSKLSQSETHSKPTKPETQSRQIITHPTRNPLMIEGAFVWWFDRRGLVISVLWWSAWFDDRRSLMIGGNGWSAINVVWLFIRGNGLKIGDNGGMILSNEERESEVRLTETQRQGERRNY